MHAELAARLQSAPVVPLVGEDDPATAVAVARALAAGGLSGIEVILRAARLDAPLFQWALFQWALFRWA